MRLPTSFSDASYRGRQSSSKRRPVVLASAVLAYPTVRSSTRTPPRRAVPFFFFWCGSCRAPRFLPGDARRPPSLASDGTTGLCRESGGGGGEGVLLCRRLKSGG